MKKFLKIVALSTLGVVFQTIARAADSTPPSTSSDFQIETNTLLLACAVLLLTVIFVLGFTLRSAVFFYHEKRKKESSNNNSGKIAGLILALIFFAVSPAIAQDAAPAVADTAASSYTDAEMLRWVLYVFIGIEIVVIFLFAKLIRFFTGIEAFQKAKRVDKSSPSVFDLGSIWTKMNRFQPIEEEASIDTGHSYDGIRELNNVTPPWFIAGFALSILFAGVYLWRYHIAESAPLQIEEYNIAVAEAKVKQDEYLKTQANNVDETSVVMLDADGIAAGQALFANNCVACHGSVGQGASVGPNLSDNYWIHSGGIKNIFKSIKYGWQEKGMKSWKEDFSANQIAQLSSYIMSLKGSNPPGAKEPQGELYTENAAPEAKADSSQQIPADTVRK